MEYHTAIKRKEALCQGKEAGHKKSHVVGFHLRESICLSLSGTDKSTETGNRLVVARDWGEWGRDDDCLMGTEFSFGVKKMFWN